MNTKYRDLTGERFGRLLVECLSHRGASSLYWWCKCDCGVRKVISGRSMKSGTVRSCCCLQRETAALVGKSQVKTGKTLCQGYVIISAGPNAGRREHRIIAEAKIGRPLEADEVVHHINEIKTDNRPENLDVIKRSEHPRKHSSGTTLVCHDCGVGRWYSPAQIVEFRDAKQYRCRRCSFKCQYVKSCKRCGLDFKGSGQAQFCKACTGRSQAVKG